MVDTFSLRRLREDSFACDVVAVCFSNKTQFTVQTTLSGCRVLHDHCMILALAFDELMKLFVISDRFETFYGLKTSCKAKQLPPRRVTHVHAPSTLHQCTRCTGESRIGTDQRMRTTLSSISARIFKLRGTRTRIRKYHNLMSKLTIS